MRNRLGIVGKPLGHSLSPLLHENGMGDSRYSYEKWELKEKELKDFLTKVKSLDSDILGFNVTIPYKEKIIEYLDELDKNAMLLGAVNTVKYEAGKLKGYNTDGLGFYESLKRHNFTVEGKKILIIGSGGAARGIAIFLSLHKVNSIDIVARNMDKGEKLVEELNKYTNSFYLQLEEIERIDISKYDLIIQATPIGMKNIKGEILFPYKNLNDKQIVADIVYNPLNTNFLSRARGRVKEDISGLEMLVYQGYHSFKIWTSLEENTEVMLKVGREFLEDKSE